MRYVLIDSASVKPSLADALENLPTADEVRELLSYDRNTGIFTWRVDRRGKAKAGTKAGALAGRGHIQITIHGARHYAHRLAWLVTHGEWPPAAMDVDHIDGNKGNNAISNLRLATPSQNAANASGLRKNNTSGFRGVSLDKRSGRWDARIYVEGVSHRLGLHASSEDAARAYDRAAYRLNGEFAALNFPIEHKTFGQLLAAFKKAASVFARPVQLKFDLGLAGGVA